MHLAWDAFVTRYRPLATALARRLTYVPKEADDVVREAIIEVWRAVQAGAVDLSTSHARNYLVRTVRDFARRSRRRPYPHLAEDEAGTLDVLDSKELTGASSTPDRQRMLGRFVRELAPADAELLARRFLRHEPFDRISAEMGIPRSELVSRERYVLDHLHGRLTLTPLEGRA